MRQWFADTLATISGLEAYTRPPGSIVTPCAYVQRISAFPHSDTTGERATVEIALLLGRSDEESAWDAIDEYVTTGTSSSIVDVLEDTAPSGFDDLAVSAWETVGGNEGANDIPYIGVVFTVEVYG